MRGISPLISTVILISLIFIIAAAVAPWALDLVNDVTRSSSNQTSTELKCNNAAFDFDTSYGTFGASWDFSSVNDTMGVRLKNTGTISLYNFSFEFTINDTIIQYYSASAATQRTSSAPLKPGQTAFINASITTDINGTLSRLRVLNNVCPSVYATQDV